MDEQEVTQALADWKKALTAVSKGQRYTIGGVKEGRTLERADLPEIRNTIDWLEKKLSALKGGGKIRVKKVVL